MKILGILSSELIVEEVLDRDMRALMTLWVTRLALRADERSVTVVFKAECIYLASRMRRALDFLSSLKLG